MILQVALSTILLASLPSSSEAWFACNRSISDSSHTGVLTMDVTPERSGLASPNGR